MDEKLILGDFTQLAEHYDSRPGYSLEQLTMLSAYIEKKRNQSIETVVDLGAGTGILTKDLQDLGFSGYALEPNPEMLNIGVNNKTITQFEFQKGTAEETGLSDNLSEWVLMGSAFHWTTPEKSLKEIYRILKPQGYFTAIYNPYMAYKSPIIHEIHKKSKEMVPYFKRFSDCPTGASTNKEELKLFEESLCCTDLFEDLSFIEMSFDVEMSKERYIETWKSYNNIRVQAGEAVFSDILTMISEKLGDLDIVTVPHVSRAWTIRSKKMI